MADDINTPPGGATPPVTPPAIGGGGQAPPTSGAPPVVSPPGGAAGDAGAGAGLPAGGAAGTTPAPAEQFEDVRDFAKANGLDLSHLPDSRAAAQYLIEQTRQRNSYTQWGQQLAPYYSQVQDFVRQLQQGNGTPAATPPAAGQGQATKANPFNLPEYDPSWRQLIQKNPVTGDLEPAPGAPPDILHRLLTYERQLQGVQTNFWRNPAEALGPIIKDTIQPLLQQYVQQNLTVLQEQQTAQQFMAQNGTWLYQRNPAGQPIIDPLTQQPILSAQGAQFKQHLDHAVMRLGINSQQAQIDYAVAMTRADILSAGGNPGAAAAAAQAAPILPGQSAKDNFLQLHNRRAANHGGSTIPAPGTPPGTPAAGQNRANMSLADRMRQDLVAAGVTDADFAG
jgi:hypothetical protein